MFNHIHSKQMCRIICSVNDHSQRNCNRSRSNSPVKPSVKSIPSSPFIQLLVTRLLREVRTCGGGRHPAVGSPLPTALAVRRSLQPRVRLGGPAEALSVIGGSCS